MVVVMVVVVVVVMVEKDGSFTSMMFLFFYVHFCPLKLSIHGKHGELSGDVLLAVHGDMLLHFFCLSYSILVYELSTCNLFCCFMNSTYT